MNAYFRLFFITFPLFLAIDILWLGVIMEKFYREQLGHLARISNGKLQPHWPTTILLYAILAAGVLIFAIMPYIHKPLTLETFGWGALYGFFGYSLYELTNYAVLANWPLPIVFVDIAWGTVLNGVVTVVVVAIARYFKIG